jgi:tetraacyldisaccharide 4'-kinase
VSVHGWLTRVWYESAPTGVVLLPLSWFFGAASVLRRSLYRWGIFRAHRIGRPVVIVGNLTVGGTGKTPLVIWLAQQMKASGFKVGIVSRGYGRSGSAPHLVEAANGWRLSGDEPWLIRNATDCPMVVAADRVAGARVLAELGVDVIIADDGLQHLRLARDFEIVVVDGSRGFGNGRLLPSGPLRESLSRLNRVDAVVVNGPSAHLPALKAFHSPRIIQMSLVAAHAVPLEDSGQARPVPLASFAGRRVHAVAGIGNPARFFDLLRAHGLDTIEHPFPDHHPFAAEDLRFLDGRPVLMTEKDAVKCRAFAREGIWYVPVKAQIDASQASALLQGVLTAVSATQTRRAAEMS